VRDQGLITAVTLLGRAGEGSEQDSGAGLSHVRSYQLLYDDAYDGEEVTSEQLHKLQCAKCVGLLRCRCVCMVWGK
jgi:hypothetical protein